MGDKTTKRPEGVILKTRNIFYLSGKYLRDKPLY